MFVTILVMSAAPVGSQSSATGAAVTSAAPADYVLHVEEGAPANAQTDGSRARPFPTIGWAVAISQGLRQRGDSVRIAVAPGTYRENVVVGHTGDSTPPLVIESEVAGGAAVSGADVETRWTPIPGTDRYSAPWAEDWGLTPIPAGWGGVDVPDGIRRREGVFIDGRPLVQVLSESSLVPNSFYVDEGDDRIIAQPPAGVDDIDDHLVEVSRRQHTLRIQGHARSVAIEGFVFEKAATPLQKSMAYITDSADVLIESNTFRHSSWGALGVCCTEGITLRDNRVVDNGGNGIDTYRTQNAVIEGNHISGNNVRGARHGYTGWSVAGSKNLLLANATFRNNTYDSNLTRGLWLDTDVQDILVDGDRSCGNLRDGLFIEATQGPLTIRNSTFCNNRGAGIAVGTSGNVTVERTTLSNNVGGQLLFTGDRSRQWVDRLTGGLIEMGDFENWSLRDNAFVSLGDERLIYSPVIPVEEWRELLRDGEIDADGNTWTRPSMDGAIRIQATDFPMEEWRALTGDTPPADGDAGAPGDPPPPGDGDGDGNGGEPRFTDIAGNTHEDMINAIAAAGVTAGCNTEGTRYCPAALVSREQMATFLRRALDLPVASRDHFPDDDDSVHEDSINRVADAGIALGRDGRFHPKERVTRAQMASFIARGFDLPPSDPSFQDVGPPHDQSIGAVEEAGITKGCTADGTRYCPSNPVRRDQMASFIGRALGLG